MLKNHFLGFVLSCLMAWPAGAAVSRSSQKEPNNWVPYPWAQELPFTWSTAQGVWTVGTGSETSYFYIRVTTDKTNKSVKFLSITEKDRATCSTIATGFGTEENNKRIVAQMKYNEQSRSRYTMMLRWYDPKGVPQNPSVQPVKGKVMVLTINSEASNQTYNYPMVKVSDRTEYPCKPTK